MEVLPALAHPTNTVIFFPAPPPIYFRYVPVLPPIITSCRQKPIPKPTKRTITVRWHPPPVGWVKVNVDGSSKGNPGESAASAICRSSEGKWIFGCTTRIGFTNSFMAEVWGIVQGLTMAWNSGFRKVILESDCLAAVNRVLGEDYQDPKHLCSHLILACRQLLKRDWICQVRHVYREANFCADFLASNFRHLPMGRNYFIAPPPELEKLMEEDLVGPGTTRIIKC
ncbi:hypothetical protein SLEP1_g58408 [Rubroshorea leprosula]|uniref:RNase H type-1 domain-containing protein n=1 Tax=Rubroshorea leprosula TaxID=152421 RepID=A0AAV5MSH7_9ROSI|nr:hypothetical protein SLEP1_g58408 [Rubroshorea leprosula]